MPRPVLWLTLLSLAGVTTLAPAQPPCDATFQPGDPAGAPQGRGDVTQVFDADGPGPLPAELVVGGRLLEGRAPRTVVAFDGTRWRELGTSPAGECTALGVFNGELIAAIETSTNPSQGRMMAWNGTTWRALGTVLGEARCMSVFNGRLVIGGSFTSVGSVAAASIAQWDGTVWSRLGTGIAGSAAAMAVYAGVLWVGGNITQAGGIPVSNLATWNGSAWAANASVDGPILAMAVRSSTTVNSSFLFVGGRFGRVGTLVAPEVARFNQFSGWTAVGAFPGLNVVESLLVRPTGSLTFELVAGPDLHVWNGTTWTRLGTTGTAHGLALAVFGGRYVAVGSNTPTVRVLDATNAWVGLSGPGIDAPVLAVAATATDVVIGGSFTSISGVSMNGIARGTVGAWQPLGSGVLGAILAVAVMPGGDIVAAGTFTAAGGTPARRIARWNGSTWSPLGPGLGDASFSDSVRALAVLGDGSLVAGGTFSTAGNLMVNNVARWDGTAWTALGAGLIASLAPGEVVALAVRPDGELVAGGDFDRSGLAPMRGVARWNGSSWLAMPAEPIGGGVSALTVLSNGDVLVGGTFSSMGNLDSRYLARWNGSAWLAVPGLTDAFPFGVGALVAHADGAPISVRSGPTRFARYDGQTVTALPDPGADFDDGVRTGNGDVFFVGDFVRAGNVQAGYVVRYVSPCPALADRYGTGCSGSGGANELRAARLPVLGGALAARATGMPVLGVALSITGITQISIPLASVLRPGLPGCELLASPDLIDILPLANGSAASNLPIPVTTPLIGLALHHQFVALELSGGFTIAAATSTNGLRFRLGVF